MDAGGNEVSDKDDVTLESAGGVAGCKSRCISTQGCEGVCVTTIAVDWEDPIAMCGLRRDVWKEHCSGDTHHDTYYMAAQAPPTSAPMTPIVRMAPASRAERINARFRDAVPGSSSDLSTAGVLIHQFDKYETAGAPWKSCNFHCDNEVVGWAVTGRLSTSIMYGRMRLRGDRVAVPLVSNDGGIVARPHGGVNISCIFGIDGATVGLSGGPNGDGCPSTWCNPAQTGCNQAGYGCCAFEGAPPQAAWRAEDLGTLLKLHEQHGAGYHQPGYHSGYNEASVDGWSWNANLPRTVEAFFYLENVGTAGQGQVSYARDAHSRFLREYGVTDFEVPLLGFDPARWDAPFRAETVDPIAILNDRFHTDPYGDWNADGSLAWSGILIHCLDGYENHEHLWEPGYEFMSATLLWGDQRVNGLALPVFSSCNGGFIFRPGPATKVICGSGQDSGGSCHDTYCPPVTDIGNVEEYGEPGDGCGQSWHPKDFGMYLKRIAAWQKRNGRNNYNEIIIEGAGRGGKGSWNRHPQETIEAFFGLPGTIDYIRGIHRDFLRQYSLDANTHPVVTLDTGNWDAPFSRA